MADKEYIDRGALLKQIREFYGCSVECDENCPVKECYERHIIMAAPAADVAPVVHARWDEDKYAFCNVCPKCGLIIESTCIKRNSGKLNLCPNCGARMDGGNNDV